MQESQLWYRQPAGEWTDAFAGKRWKSIFPACVTGFLEEHWIFISNNAKTEFIRKWTAEARMKYVDRYL